MEWYEYLITTGIPTVAIIYVGFVLKKEISSYKSINEAYKSLVDATNPDKIVALQKREIELMEKNSADTIDKLKTQVIELAKYAAYDLVKLEIMAKSINEDLNIQIIVNRNMPNSIKVLDVAIAYYRKELALKNSNDGAKNN